MAGLHHAYGMAGLRQSLIVPFATLILLILEKQTQAWVAPTVSDHCTRQRSLTFKREGSSSFSAPTFWQQRRPTVHRSRCLALKNDNNDEPQPPKKEENLLGFLADPFESKIPEEYKNEIYRAEGNTKAAQERGPRIALYAFVAFIGIGCAFFNAFLTELRHPADETMTAMSLEDLGFDWVQSNFFFQFLFMNKIGGGLALIGGAACGLLAELEFDSRRKNAEAIWEELQTRKQQKMKQRQRLQNQQQGSPKRKKREGNKETKRMAALMEVVDLVESRDDVVKVDSTSLKETQKETTEQEEQSKEAVAAGNQPEEENKNLLQTLQGFYEKADAIAASQALLINKKLEDAGVLEKVTDETGLKVIGRDAAAKLNEQQDKAESTPATEQRQENK